ncbi:hypothetical protein CYY_002464 [Polysphondylium violaceum]|uniref:Uncharacterized protein n=1 Tax=Polysphondylium violaceum TaxID=133409 RepID=A0A8J4PY15_9MYCE|nr:hypothetical protein CYY_002464 [Polysphondylium violaceum]
MILNTLTSLANPTQSISKAVIKGSNGGFGSNGSHRLSNAIRSPAGSSISPTTNVNINGKKMEGNHFKDDYCSYDFNLNNPSLE